MATEKQLAALKKPTHEQAVERGRLGGVASGQKRKQASVIKECMKILRENPISKEQAAEWGLPEDTLLAMGLAIKWIDQSVKNPQYARLVAEMMGESKTEIDINGAMPVVIHDDID